MVALKISNPSRNWAKMNYVQQVVTFYSMFMWKNAVFFVKSNFQIDTISILIQVSQIRLQRANCIEKLGQTRNFKEHLMYFCSSNSDFNPSKVKQISFIRSRHSVRLIPDFSHLFMVWMQLLFTFDFRSIWKGMERSFTLPPLMRSLHFFFFLNTWTPFNYIKISNC